MTSGNHGIRGRPSLSHGNPKQSLQHSKTLPPVHAMAGSPTKQRVTKPAWWLKSIVAISKSICSVHLRFPIQEIRLQVDESKNLPNRSSEGNVCDNIAFWGKNISWWTGIHFEKTISPGLEHLHANQQMHSFIFSFFKPKCCHRSWLKCGNVDEIAVSRTNKSKIWSPRVSRFEDRQCDTSQFQASQASQWKALRSRQSVDPTMVSLQGAEAPKVPGRMEMWASRSKLSAELRNKPGLSIRNSTMRSSFLRIQHSVHDSIIISTILQHLPPKCSRLGYVRQPCLALSCPRLPLSTWTWLPWSQEHPQSSRGQSSATQLLWPGNLLLARHVSNCIYLSLSKQYNSAHHQLYLHKRCM